MPMSFSSTASSFFIRIRSILRTIPTPKFLVLKYFLLLLYFLSIFCCSSSEGQNVYSYNININNDLPDNRVYRMITDRLGYLWLGTPKGVVKYNGYELKLF